MNRILIVEDDRFFREMFIDILHDGGYQVDAAISGEEALCIMNDVEYDLVITDLVMSGISGMDLLARIKSTDPTIDVIMVTGNANLESAIFSLKHGARDYLLKPINPDELLHSVNLCMEQRRLLSENLELRNMVGLFQTSQALASSIDLEGASHLVLEALAREVGVSRGVLFLVDAERKFKSQQIKGIYSSCVDIILEIFDKTLQKNSFRDGKPLRIIIPNKACELEALDIREAMLIPVVSKGELIALVSLFNDFGHMIPSAMNMSTLSFIQERGTRALENSLRFTNAKELLYMDDLSGLYNYRYLKVALEREIKRADRYSTHLTVMFLDLDNFKSVNDTNGHMVGSRVLKEVGDLLKKSVREVDTVIRYGGDEYTLILVETPPAIAMRVGERIRSTIADNVFLEADGYNIRVTASIGFSCYPEDTTATQELLQMADRAMYAGKASGKNCIYRIAGRMSGSAVTNKEMK